MREATTQQQMDYFRLPRPLWRKLKKYLPKKRKNSKEAAGPGPPRGPSPTLSGTCFGRDANGRLFIGIGSGSPQASSTSVSRGGGRMGIFEKLMKRMVEYYARESGGIGWKWQAMDSKNSPAPLGGEKTGKNPTDRGKRGAKINLLVDERGAPLSVVLTGANRHDKVSAIDLIVSIALKRPAQKEQHLCADKAYDASDVREFAASDGLHRPTSRSTPERKSSPNERESSKQEDSQGEPHPARRWVVERTISWLTKRRSLRTRWSKKAENWLALIQLACAHVLLNLAVFG